jgi:hypothetical protein
MSRHIEQATWARLQAGTHPPPTHWVPGIERPKREADHSPAASGADLIYTHTNISVAPSKFLRLLVAGGHKEEVAFMSV